jgi:LSD1 subclass zinc finger protein
VLKVDIVPGTETATTVQIKREMKPCGTLLYAAEGASTVQCPLCHTLHDVELLRESLKAYVTDMLFTRADLVNLMETRLNDRIPQPTFTKLLRDGRLQPRKYEQELNAKDEWVAVPMYTYNDVCEARAKDPPHKRTRVS